MPARRCPLIYRVLDYCYGMVSSMRSTRFQKMALGGTRGPSDTVQRSGQSCFTTDVTVARSSRDRSPPKSGPGHEGRTTALLFNLLFFFFLSCAKMTAGDLFPRGRASHLFRGTGDRVLTLLPSGIDITAFKFYARYLVRP